jgi:hypothetical protein
MPAQRTFGPNKIGQLDTGSPYGSKETYEST